MIGILTIPKFPFQTGVQNVKENSNMKMNYYYTKDVVVFFDGFI